ncbi:sensor histidine kinase [Paenibacillus silvae]|uniref:sensor histidine kinase n=1 Tax=Paenibacillus silvae TaxID=1325358 RepID=UPI0020062781|nr:sensor histidine kinase [Paenibacillus silvae]MCK6074161.1 sensor histidine kinase [Paenibacillus silvae]MCK6148361.1 sensor histidine kinase [Paenibacillus silvae]MCK6266661.1 sensor histidine kinase [Paenibacillus silvae]
MNLIRSLRFKFIVGLTLIMLPLFLLLYYNNVYAMKVVRDKVSLTYMNHLAKNVEQNERVLQETNRYLYSLGERDPDIISLFFLQYGSGDYIIAKQRIMNKFMTDIGFYNLIDSFYLYDAVNDDLLLATAGNYDIKKSVVQRSMPAQLRQLEGDIQKPEWSIVRGGSFNALVKTVRINQQFYAGALVDMNALNDSQQFTESGDRGGAVIVTPDGRALSDSTLDAGQIKLAADHLAGLESPYQVITETGGQARQYLMVGIASAMSEMNYVVLLPEEDMMRNLPFFQQIIRLLPIGAAVILITALFFLRQLLFRPMNALIRGMRRVSRGELNVTLEAPSSSELEFVTRSFNQMIQEIQHLKIDVYEEQLRTREAEFKQLQMQINPHFYLNSLNIIHSLASLQKHELVQQMAGHLADYFRFSLRAGKRVISLNDEIEHIRHYLEIQKLRFPSKLEFELDIDAKAGQYVLPPLTIQPFVENAIIHGFQRRMQPFVIRISARVKEAGDGDAKDGMLELQIKDSGVGFAPELLEQLQQAQYARDPGGQHIGIWNVAHRLLVKYGSEAGLTFENRIDGGAVVRIYLPAQTEEQEGGTHAEPVDRG